MRLIDLFDKACSYHPDRAFVIQGTRTISYRDAATQSKRIAEALRRDGLTSGATVGVYSSNSIELILALLGIMRANCAFVPLNAMNAVAENVQILLQTGCSGLFFHSKFGAGLEDHRSVLSGVSTLVCLDSESEIAASLENWSKAPGVSSPESAVSPADTWAIYMTSGTTGQPKGVVHSHANVLTATSDMLLCLGSDRAGRHLIVSPITHMAGMMMFALTTAGATHILLDTTEPAAIAAALAETQAEIIFLPPTLIYLMLACPGVRTHDYSALRRFVYAGAPMAPQKVSEAISVFGSVLTNIYAQTELLAPVTCLRPDEHRPGESEEWDRRLASIGRPTYSRIAAIMAEDGTLLPAGSIGELVIRSNCVLQSYLGDPQATAAVREHGWHHTGDIGVMDDEGYITLVDRKKDMIVTGGFNVFSAEVERVLLSHPDIQEAAVIGVPDEKWGEAVKAVVELKPGSSPTPEALISFCKEHLGSVKAPKSVDFRTTLPRSANGKVLKREIRDEFWASSWRKV